MATRKSTRSKAKDAPERVGRLGGSDTRSGAERLMSKISEGISKDKRQNRRWDDSPETRAKNLRATERRLAAEKKKRGGR